MALGLCRACLPGVLQRQDIGEAGTRWKDDYAGGPATLPRHSTWSLSFSLGIFVYGWGVEKHIHWAVPQVGTAMTGFGYILIFTAVQTYLIDTFEDHSASVNGANAALRGLAGALIPLSGLDLYKTLGWGWGNSLLAFIALALAPLLWFLAVYGEKIRRTQPFKLKL